MAGPTRDSLRDLSLELTGAVLAQERWGSALQHMADLFGGSFATFELIDKRSGRHLQYFDCSDIEVRQDYLNHFLPLNPRIAFGNRAGAPTVLHDHLFLDDDEMDRDPFYADFLRPFDLRYFLSFRAYDSADAVGVFTVQRNARAGAADAEIVSAIEHIGGALSDVAEAQKRYGELLSDLTTMEVALASMSFGVITFDTAGRVVEMNSVAQDMCRQADGLSVVGGALKAANDLVQEKLARTLFGVLGDGSQREAFSHMLLPRRSGLPPYKLTFRPRLFDGLGGYHSSGAVAFVEDPCRDMVIDIEHLKDGFGFTTAEARVALLMAKGQSASEMAASSGVSIATIRTQIQRVLNKAGARRQIDLVRILSRYV
ncbi:MAG: hypothetical protein AAFY73_00130 [Pseudomonadota bacterium]